MSWPYTDPYIDGQAFAEACQVRGIDPDSETADEDLADAMADEAYHQHEEDD
jgi:hypothetical protein